MLASLPPQFAYGVISLVFLFYLVFSFYRDSLRFCRAQSQGQSSCQKPPRYPTRIPYLGSVISFLSDGQNYLPKATAFAGQLTSSRVAFLPWFDVYFFQDRQTIREIWKQSSLLSTAHLRVFAHQKLFGMPSKWVKLYQPERHNVVNEVAHIPHDLHKTLLKALIGSRSAPMFKRFQAALMDNLSPATRRVGWISKNDFRDLVHQTVGLALVQAVFGPSFLQINPTFMTDIIAFIDSVPWLSKGLPQFIRPGPFKVRRRLLEGFKRWYHYSREHFVESTIADDGDGDPFWGSAWMRDRQAVLGALNDDDLMASQDLGAAFGLLVNLMPSTIMTLLHLFEDQSVVHHLRTEIQATYGQCSAAEFDIQHLSSMPLLHSIYAETLRLHSTSYTVLSAPDKDVPLGRWLLPKGGIGLISPQICHLDPNFWNTQRGTRPLQSFWAERFITDPSDPSSGPILPELVAARRAQKKIPNDNITKPYVSMEGLEGSYIPYAGGQLICPGRFLAQKVITYSCVLFASELDIRVSPDLVRFQKSKYGLGTEEPQDALPYSMKARGDDR